jgi:hypothetical protein
MSNPQVMGGGDIFKTSNVNSHLILMNLIYY